MTAYHSAGCTIHHRDTVIAEAVSQHHARLIVNALNERYKYMGGDVWTDTGEAK